MREEIFSVRLFPRVWASLQKQITTYLLTELRMQVSHLLPGRGAGIRKQRFEASLLGRFQSEPQNWDLMHPESVYLRSYHK